MKTFVKEVEGFNIYFEALEENTPLEDTLDDSVTDIEKIREDIENGELEYFCAKVTAEKAGIELADDYLGCCIYKSYEAFYTDYFDDMASNVVSEAKEKLKELAI